MGKKTTNIKTQTEAKTETKNHAPWEWPHLLCLKGVHWMAKTIRENCVEHSGLETRTDISMSLLGANLLGVVIIVLMVGWNQIKTIPEMEKNISQRIGSLAERTAKLEQWKETIDHQKDYDLSNTANIKMMEKNNVK